MNIEERNAAKISGLGSDLGFPCLRIESELQIQVVETLTVSPLEIISFEVIQKSPWDVAEKSENRHTFKLYRNTQKTSDELVFGFHGWQSSSRDLLISELALSFAKTTGALVITPDWQNNSGLAFDESLGQLGPNGNRSPGELADFRWTNPFIQFSSVLTALQLLQRNDPSLQNIGAQGTTLYGHSFGALFARDLAARYFLGVDPRFRNLAVKEVFDISGPYNPVAAMRVVVNKALVQSGKYAHIQGHAHLIDALIERWRAQDKFPLPETFLSGHCYPLDSSFHNYTFATQFDRIVCPYRRYYGERDEILRADPEKLKNDQLLNLRENTSLESIAEAGHTFRAPQRAAMAEKIVGGSIAARNDTSTFEAFSFAPACNERPIFESHQLSRALIETTLKMVDQVPIGLVLDFLVKRGCGFTAERFQNCYTLNSAVQFSRDKYAETPLLLWAAANRWVALQYGEEKADNLFGVPPQFFKDTNSQEMGWTFEEAILKPLEEISYIKLDETPHSPG